MTKKQITTWASRGKTPTFVPGRWVQLGRPTVLNYWLTGLPGGKIYARKCWPFFEYVPNRTEFANHATMLIDCDQLETPSGWGPDGWVKGLFGQRRIKENWNE